MVLMSAFSIIFLLASLSPLSAVAEPPVKSKAISPFLLNYINLLKSKFPNNQKRENDVKPPTSNLKMNAKKSESSSLVSLPDGLPPKLVVGPGKVPKNFLQVMSRRADESLNNNDVTCKDHEWFVYVNDMPACVNPVWDGGYDPTFCAKLKSGWIYCGCDDNQVPGMKDGLDTCLNKVEFANGRCNIKPCPEGFTCEDHKSDHYFNCVKGEMKVPTWY